MVQDVPALAKTFHLMSKHISTQNKLKATEQICDSNYANRF